MYNKFLNQPNIPAFVLDIPNSRGIPLKKKKNPAKRIQQDKHSYFKIREEIRGKGQARN